MRSDGDLLASPAVLLFLSSCTTAIIHALIPDHWLPLVLMGRSQRWTDRHTSLMVGLAGVLHVAVTLLVGGLAITLGTGTIRELAVRLGTSLETLAGLLLAVFGLTYGIWAHRREARAHGPARQATGPGRHVHAHGHLLEHWYHGSLTGGALVAIIGISPCVLLQPILFAAAAEGVAALAACALGFALGTVGTMVGVAAFATRAVQRIELPFFTRFGDLASGLLIAVTGLLIVIVET
jgi:nickel/cobalt exporter